MSSMYITQEKRQELGERLILTDRQVKVWFQNKRYDNSESEVLDVGI